MILVGDFWIAKNVGNDIHNKSGFQTSSTRDHFTKD